MGREWQRTAVNTDYRGEILCCGTRSKRWAACAWENEDRFAECEIAGGHLADWGRRKKGTFESYDYIHGRVRHTGYSAWWTSNGSEVKARDEGRFER